MTVSETQCEAAKDKDCRDASPPSMPGKVLQADRDGVNRVAAVRTAAAEKAAADMALLEDRVEQLEELCELVKEIYELDKGHRQDEKCQSQGDAKENCPERCHRRRHGRRHS